MNWIFLGIVLVAFGAAAWRQLGHLPAEGVKAPMEALSGAMISSASGAVELAIGLVGVMTLFLGLMIFGVSWQNNEPAAVEVELWSALPSTVSKPVPQRPKPEPEPKPEPKPKAVKPEPP